MKANSSKRTLWLVSLVLILALLLAVGVSGAWFTASKTGSANVTMGEAVEIELVNNGSGWDTIDDTDVLPGSDFVPKVQIKSLSLTHSIIRAKWEFSMLDGDVAVTPKTQTEIDAIADENERAYQQQVKDLFDYYAITQAANMHVKTSGVNVSDQYYIYSAADGYYYFNKVQNSTELLDFTSDTIIVPTTITNELKFHTLRLTFIAESVQILAINSENFSSTGWGEWSNLPTAIQEMIDQYNENPIASAMEDVELADFEYEVVDANSNGSYSEAEGDYILLKRYTGILRQYRVKSHYTIDTDTLLPVVDAGSTSLSTSLATTATLPVKTIGNGVDTFDDKVVNIDLPSTVDTINNSAFAGNTSLESVQVNGETAFTTSSGTISTAPSASEWVGGIYIGYEAFVGTNISNVTIPSGVDFTINTGAFDSDVGFTYNGTKYDTLEDLQDAMTAAGDSLTLDTSVLFTPAAGSGGGGLTHYYYDPTGTYSYVDSYGTWTFDINGNTATIRTYIPADKYNGGEITELTIPNQVTYAGNTYPVVALDCHNYQKALADVDSNNPAYYFMSSEQYVAGKEQAHSKNLLTGSLTIPASVLKLGRNIFMYSNITTLVIEGDLTTDSNTFGYCENLTSITANNLAIVGEYMFDGCHALEEVSLPKVTEVKFAGFYHCTSLITVNMPNVIQIGEQAFFRCTALSKFNSTTEGVADLHNVAIIYGAPDVSYFGAFEECTSLVSVYFGSNVYIGARAFKNCSALTNIYFATTGAASLSAENSQINVGDRDGDGNDDFITASTITDDYTYSLTGTNCNLTVNGSPAAESYAAGTTIDLTVSVDSGYIRAIRYYALVLNGEGKYELTEMRVYADENKAGFSSSFDNTVYIHEGLQSYTISGLVMNCGQAIKVTKEFKVTGDIEGGVLFGTGWHGRMSGSGDTHFKDQFGNIYYPDVGYTLTQDITLTKATREDGAKDYVYNVTYMFNDVDVSEELSNTQSRIYEHNNFALRLPTYGVSNGNKYIAGWTDNNGHAYMFEDDGEEVNLDWATGDVVLHPIWQTAPVTVTFDGGPNKLVFDIKNLYCTNWCIRLPSLLSNAYWWDYTNEVGYRSGSYVKYSDLTSNEYTFSAQLLQGDDIAWAEVEKIVGYNGAVASESMFTFDTGYDDGATSTESASISYDRHSSYSLPAAPTANDGWTFLGWVADRDVVVGSSSNEATKAGTLISPYSYIYTLEPTNWTAIWFKPAGITIDTGYSTGATSTESATINYSAGNRYYTLPNNPTANEGYIFKGWVADKDVTVYNGEIKTAGTLLSAGSNIYTLEPTNWTAAWAHITVDTGYASGATSTESASISYRTGNDYYKLPSAPTAIEGYIFRGWVADIDVVVGSASNDPTTAGTIIAVESSIYTLEETNWSAVWLHVTVDNGYSTGATSTEISSIVYTAAYSCYSLPAPTANEGYIFRGWVANRDVVVDSSSNSATPAGELISADSRIFTLEDTNWTAVWAHITVDTGYSTGATSTESASISYTTGNNYYYLPVGPVKNDGYIFFGWVADRDVVVGFAENTPTTAGTYITEGSEIYTLEDTNWRAVWFNSNIITIDTGYASGATSTESLSISYTAGNNYYSLPYAPEANSGWTFEGWVADRDVVNGMGRTITAGTTVSAGLDIYTLEATNWIAQWSNGYSITYDLNGGKGEVPVDSNSYQEGDSATILSGAGLTNGSLVFRCWNTDPNGKGEEVWPDSYYTMQSDLTLYAQYSEPVAAEVNITYNQGDVKPEEGAVPSSHTAVVGNTIYLPNCDIKVKGYRFVGWLCNLDGNTYKAGDGYTVSNSDVEFVAQWESDAPVVTIGMLVEAPNCTVKYGQNNSDVSTMNVYSEWVSGFNADDTIYIAIFGANGEVVDANNISISGGCEGNYSKETRTENGETFVLITCWPTLSSSIFVQFSDYTWYEKYIPYWGAESTKNEQSAKISAIDSVMDGATAAFVETVYVGSDESNNWLVAFVEEGGETLVIAFVFEGSSDTLLGFIQRFEDGTYTCESMGGDEAVLTSVNNKLFQEWYTKYIPNWGTESTKTEQSAKIAAIDSVMGEGASNMLPETVYVGNDEANSWLVAILEEDGDTYVYAFVFDGTTGEPQVILNHDGTGARGDAFEGGDETLINTYCNKLFPEWYTKYIPNWGTVSTKTEQSAKMDSIAQVMEGYEEMMAETVYVGTDGTNNWLVAIVPEELEVFAFIFDEATQTLQGMIYANEDGAGHAGGDEALVGPYVDVLFPPL